MGMINMAGPLVGYRVLDLSRILAGPWLGQLLADLGAEVWKVERPGTGDDTRQWGPPFLKNGSGEDTSESAYFLSANRGKQSICIDIASLEGRDLVRALVRNADVVLENYKVGDLARYGLGYDDLKKEKPDIVYCSITGYGQTGPFKDTAGYDMAIQAIGGLMSLTGERDDLPGGGPQKVGVPIVDILTGMYGATAVISSLLHRERTGEGQYIDMALLDVQVSVLANQNMNFLTTGSPPGRSGNAHPNIVPYQAFATADGSFILAIGNDGQFRKFCSAAGLSSLADDARFCTNANRLQHRDVLIPLLAARLVGESTGFWIALLEPLGVPCAPINRLDQVFAHPQVRHRGLRVDLPHTAGANAPLVGNPIKFSKTPIEYSAPPPVLGEHTDHILRNVLKLADEDVRRLRERGVV
jgi:crotonobetainyl-CoA:carnitine CoA-transferase CaiB-like acyl-CoA transferase